MAGEQLPARFSLRSQTWFQWTGKCFETATSHMQTVEWNCKKTPESGSGKQKSMEIFAQSKATKYRIKHL